MGGQSGSRMAGHTIWASRGDTTFALSKTQHAVLKRALASTTGCTGYDGREARSVEVLINLSLGERVGMNTFKVADGVGIAGRS